MIQDEDYRNFSRKFETSQLFSCREMGKNFKKRLQPRMQSVTHDDNKVYESHVYKTLECILLEDYIEVKLNSPEWKMHSRINSTTSNILPYLKNKLE